MDPLATADDYDNWTDGADRPANLNRLLRAASRMVRRDTISAVYDVDTLGAPTSTTISDALRDATCAQAEAWGTLGIDPTAGGVVTSGKTVAAKSLDGASITYAGATDATTARAAATNALVPEAVAVLTDAGLLGGRPLTYG